MMLVIFKVKTTEEIIMARGYHHVTRDQRCQINAWKASEWSIRNIIIPYSSRMKIRFFYAEIFVSSKTEE